MAQIRDGRPLPVDDVELLEWDAIAEGVGNVTTLLDRWRDGSERYGAGGEALLLAVESATSTIIGVGGLAHCPDVVGALRMRRFYVHSRWRRGGVARSLAEALVADAARSTTTVTCHAGASDAAPRFWESVGFVSVDRPGITHLRHVDERGGDRIES